jgi:hypothetical protein
VDRNAGEVEEMNIVISQLVWLGIFLAISFGISMILPFPTSLVVVIGFFILLNMYRKKAIMKRMGVGGTGIFPSGTVTGVSSLKYYLIHRKRDINN